MLMNQSDINMFVDRIRHPDWNRATQYSNINAAYGPFHEILSDAYIFLFSLNWGQYG